MSCELPEVYSATQPKARKQHKCCECRGVIERGEHYQLVAGLWSGEWDTFKTCLECSALRDELRAELRKEGYDDDEGLAFGQVYEEVFEREHLPLIRRFMDIRRKRGAPESPRGWMEQREKDREREAAEAEQKSTEEAKR